MTQALALLAIAAIVFLGVHLVLAAFDHRGTLGAHDRDEGVQEFRRRKYRDWDGAEATVTEYNKKEPPAAA